MPLVSFPEDVNRIRTAINSTADPILLVGYSYGGAAITEAGNDDKVKGLVYVAGFVPDVGESVGSLAAINQTPGGASIYPDDAGYLWLNKTTFHDTFCHDLTEGVRLSDLAEGSPGRSRRVQCHPARLEAQADLVPDLGERPHA